MQSPDFKYDSSHFFHDLMMSWTFPVISFYRKNIPSPDNLINIPKRVKFDTSLTSLEEEWAKESVKPSPSFLKALLRVIGWDIFKYFLPGIFGYNLGLAQALLVIYLTRYIEESSADPWDGVLYITLYAVSTLFSYFFLNLSAFKVFTLIARVKSMIPCLLYQKLVNISQLAISEGNTKGKIANIIGSELEILDGMTSLVWLFSLPIFLIGAFFIIGFTTGVAGVIGLVVVILHFPAIMLVCKIAGNFRIKVNIAGDVRIKMITSLIEGIRIVKLYGWESPNLETIFKQRALEIKTAYKKICFLSLNRTLSNGGIGLTLFITFLIYIYLGNELEPGIVYSTATILLMTQTMVSYIGSLAVFQLFLFIIAMKRVTEILVIKNNTRVSLENSEDYAIKLSNANFSWKEAGEIRGISRKSLKIDAEVTTYDGDIVLEHVNAKVRKGELVIVVGPVGCGKTSLLMGLMQEIPLIGGDMSINGSIAVAGEDPWIVSGTIKDNVLMGLEYEEKFYKKVISACALDKDIEKFKFGDNTWVGDKGITLSGGQKARLSLARAAYTNRDILLLDDPLSAVDAEVSSHLFKKCIKDFLREKTVILATHQTHYISEADKILVLNSGSQLFFGEFNDLKLKENIMNLIGEAGHQKPKAEQKSSVNGVRDIEFNTDAKGKSLMQEEEKTIMTIPFKIYYKFLTLGSKNWLMIPILLAILTVTQALYSMTLWWLSVWSKADPSDQGSSFYLWVYAVIILCLYLFTYLRGFLFGVGLLKNAEKLHNSALKGITESEVSFFDKNPTGNMVARFSKDTMMVDETLITFFIEFISTTILLLGNVTVIAIIAPPNLAAIIAFLFYLFILIRTIVPLTTVLKRLELASKSPILSLVNSTLSGLPVIRCLDLQQKFTKEMKKFVTHNLRAYLTYHMMLRFYQGYSELGATIVSILNVIILILYKGNISNSVAAMSISFTISTSGWANWWAKTMIETENLMASPQRLLEYSEIPKEGDYESDIDFKITNGHIEFKNLYMKYRENLPCVLKSLNLKIEGGKKVGIIGRTGAGKSSIMHALFRLVNPCSGTIFIDGQNYLEIGLHQLRKQLSVIPQSPTIFLASIRDNLDPFHEHTDEEIDEVLKHSKLYDLVSAFPQGLDHILAGDGGNLSAGQKQLFCLARALIRKNKIVMMDEATANVDRETDKLIQKKIKKKFRGSTLLIVAHRLRTIVDSDIIIVMDGGACKEIDSPKMLVSQESSLFRKMIMCTGAEESNYLLNKISSH
ncbi:unnamed protein product [Blepharisma stoltei]|uniref:Uncharacterized protein n=1 Tax=Blepharisma stoltei TaxID=1481888 RepID=A0AAU9J2X1_9CILI|nr:unnamed protein product [Blepharisma stoltei]